MQEVDCKRYKSIMIEGKVFEKYLYRMNINNQIV